ncbi:deoxycytidylate deaminase [Methylobacterium sp. WL122]|nr:deoxycytidylate deaminase [Methylobacterium sp. WL122]
MLPTAQAPELVFGLCSPIGTKNKKFVEILKANLLKFHYQSQDFKVTELMKSVKIKDMVLKDTPIEDRYTTHIEYANKFREIKGQNGALAMLCCSAISAYRQKKGKNYLEGQAYIFDQFKRGEEIKILRQTYQKAFVLISLYSGKENRIKYLSHRISADHIESRPSVDHEGDAKKLVRRDEDEQGQSHGQRLADAFALADLFINLDNEREAEETLNRFLLAFFGSNKISPSKDEYGIYIAKSAALRSLDLSRQVGAAIFSANGEVQTLGCNEVPKANGGTYWSSDADDARDYTLEGDENERIKRAILADTVRRLALSGFISDQSQVDELVSKVIAESSKKDSPLKGSQLMDLLEFGRIIHAEMSAISDAARLGIPIKGSILYCTTFPCHMCSKHIVAAGIGRVLYIEPYPKSYADQLQQDSLYVGTGANKTQKVQFSPFIGISPLRFRDLFERGKRKDDKGFFSDWMEGKPKPLVDYTIAIYLNSEEEKRKLIKEILAELLRKGEILEFSDHDVSQQVEAAQQLTVASSPSTDATPDA